MITKVTLKIKLLLILICIAFTSCWKTEDFKAKPNPNDLLTDTDKKSFDFNVPKEFKWESFQTINSTIRVHNRYDSAVEYFVEIYDGEDMIDAGITKNGIYSSSLIVRNEITTLGIVQKDLAGFSAKVNVAISGPNLFYDFNHAIANASTPKAKSAQSKTTNVAPKSPVIPAEAIEVVDGTTLIENGIYRISKGSVINNVKLDAVGGIQLYIEGEYNISQNSWLAGSKTNYAIFILKGGKLTSKGEIYANNHKNLKIVNYGEFTTTGTNAKLHINGDIINNGKLSIGDGNAELLLLEGSTFENYEEFKASRLGFSAGTIIKNYGNIQLSSEVWCQTKWLNGKNTSFKLLENCGNFITNGQIQLTGGQKLDNYGRLESKSKINIHNIAELIIYPQSLIKAQGIDFQKSKVISNGDAIIKISNSLTIDSNTTFIGNNNTPSVIWAPNGYKNVWFSNVSNVTGKWFLDPDPKIWGAKWNNGVVLGNLGYIIASTQYNDGGYNSNKTETPEPPKSINFSTTPKVVVFEDNYPSIGDYDFNDVVMEWKLRGTKDGDDIVKDLYIDVTVKACGAIREIGAGVRISPLTPNILSAKIETKKPNNHDFGYYFSPQNGIETDINGVVVPLFENVHTLFGLNKNEFINVSNDESARGDYYKFSVKLEFAEEITGKSLNSKNFNFFITTSVNEKGRTEIHTFGNDVSMAANNEISFKNQSAIWALELPKEFLHPIERENITNVYTQFKPWVESSGLNNVKWYKFPNNELIVHNNKKSNN